MESHKREKHKEKRRSNEKRKERSRDAARCRRSRETDIFSELAAALPVDSEQAAHLDKASVMRLAIAYLKVRAVVDSVPAPLTKCESSGRMDRLCPKALNGFMLILSSDGNMVYLSENVSDYLGVSQMDMMGQSVYEYSHPCDHDELRECLSAKSHDSTEKRTCNFFLRLKCTLTSKGRKVNLKSASYKVIHCIGRLTNIRDANCNSIDLEDEDRDKEDGEKESQDRATETTLVLVGSPIPHPSNIEMPLGQHTFLSKHSLGMKFTYVDEKLAEYLGWDSEDLMGQSVFEFYHALDNLILDRSFKSLFSKGQCETVAYRFLGRRGGYAWVVTQATLIHCSKQQKPVSVVCVNYVLSGLERENEVYSARQLAARRTERCLTEKTQGHRDVEESSVGKEELANAAAAEGGAGAAVDDGGLTVVSTDAEPRLLASEPDLEPAPVIEPDRRTKPLTVTTSTFRPALGFENRRKPLLRDGPRKDNTLPRPVNPTEKLLPGARILKDQLKENNQPEYRELSKPPGDIRKPSRPVFIFQGKPAVEYDPENASRRGRPQTVTKHLFVPLVASGNNQQQKPSQSPLQNQQGYQQQLQEQLSCRPPPQTATASIFAPRTEDMNKGFLTFSEDQPGLTMLKDEPEDLTHLAPTPGDVCVPLEDTPFLSDMLDEFILGSDNYCPLLSPDGTIPSADFGDPLKDAELTESGKTKDLDKSLSEGDPFMYGEPISSPSVVDPATASPPLAKYHQSPDRSMGSIDSPATGDSVTEGFSEDEMLMLGITDPIGDEELELRAPYIPMSDQDETLEQLISDEMVMWGANQPAKKSSLSSTPCSSSSSFASSYAPSCTASPVEKSSTSASSTGLSAFASSSFSSSGTITITTSSSNFDALTSSTTSSRRSSFSIPPTDPKWSDDERARFVVEPSLEQLLQTEQIGLHGKRYNDHGGGLVNPAQVLGQIPRKGTAAASQMERWFSKNERTVDRPSKRPHGMQVTAIDSENENKRVKCERTNGLDESFGPEDRLLLEKERLLPNKHQSSGFNIASSSQLLRRLVSQKTRLDLDYSSTLLDNTCVSADDLECHGMFALETDMEAEGSLELDERAADGGGGTVANIQSGHRKLRREDDGSSLNSRDQRPNPGTPCSSVLMNLLVSGCDARLEGCRDVPNPLLTSPPYLSPLMVNPDDQTTSPCPGHNEPTALGVVRTSIQNGKQTASEFSLSADSMITTFDNFDYDPGVGLLQVNPEFFGSLLDQNLV